MLVWEGETWPASWWQQLTRPIVAWCILNVHTRRLKLACQGEKQHTSHLWGPLCAAVVLAAHPTTPIGLAKRMIELYTMQVTSPKCLLSVWIFQGGDLTTVRWLLQKAASKGTAGRAWHLLLLIKRYSGLWG